ncbi:hypothetical protein QBC35DRAFT_187479 [Podospora australis]|uniref:Uncharacterized protein n=1 Tax=Podospora australis TaxID=1536484 RepID=A0AAN6WUL8_9PEZI|nr:hypothetical protein QBC35DRAFT_187479 [Podospora australis]
MPCRHHEPSSPSGSRRATLLIAASSRKTQCLDLAAAVRPRWKQTKRFSCKQRCFVGCQRSLHVYIPDCHIALVKLGKHGFSRAYALPPPLWSVLTTLKLQGWGSSNVAPWHRAMMDMALRDIIWPILHPSGLDSMQLRGCTPQLLDSSRGVSCPASHTPSHDTQLPLFTPPTFPSSHTVRIQTHSTIRLAGRRYVYQALPIPLKGPGLRTSSPSIFKTLHLHSSSRL